jgi:hypothetical protein
MTQQYIPDAGDFARILVLGSDGDPASAAIFNAPLQKLGDMTAWLRAQLIAQVVLNPRWVNSATYNAADVFRKIRTPNDDDMIVLLAVGGTTGPDGLYAISTDCGLTWTRTAEAGNNNTYYDVVWSQKTGSGWHIVGDNGAGAAVLRRCTSKTAITWVDIPVAGTTRLRGITASDANIIMVGDGGAIRTKPDSASTTITNRTQAGPPYSGNFMGVTFANGVAIAYGTGAEIQRSIDDGVTWERVAKTGVLSEPENQVCTFANALYMGRGKWFITPDASAANEMAVRSDDNGATFYYVTNGTPVPAQLHLGKSIDSLGDPGPTEVPGAVILVHPSFSGSSTGYLQLSLDAMNSTSNKLMRTDFLPQGIQATHVYGMTDGGTHRLAYLVGGKIWLTDRYMGDQDYVPYLSP